MATDEIEIVVRDPEPSYVGHWHLWEWLVSIARFVLPIRREETSLERSQARSIEALESRVKIQARDLEILRAQMSAKQALIDGYAECIAAHEARWKAEAICAAIRTVPEKR